MKALILVGGYGTRLRPLTLTVPKPLIDFCNKPIVERQAGVDHIILAVAHQPEAMMDALRSLEVKFKIRISCSREEEPLGTAGPIRLAEQLLRDGENESSSFFVLNSDVICDFPLKDMAKFHASHDGEGTLLVTKVKNPSIFGVVISEPKTGRVTEFIEKPTEFVGDQINAGVYLLKTSAISRFELRPSSIEREIFPAMAKVNTLYSFMLNGFWADIGQSSDFLRGMTLYLEQAKIMQLENLSSGSNFIGNVLVHPSAKIGASCLIGPDVTIGEDCVIGDGVRLVNAAIMTGVCIEGHCHISRAIIGWHSRIEKWVRIEGLTVVGEDVKIKAECFVNQAIILPHKQISEGIYEPGKIIM